jgi:hypothetical protein
MIVTIKNTLSLGAAKTYLSTNEVQGTNVLHWKNANGFSASWGVQVGETGEEQTEVVLLGTATPAGTAGTLTANDSYEHPADTPLYAIKYNQVVFERSITGTTGTATPITNGTVYYAPDGTVTAFDDTTGTTGYAYKVFFRNSVLGTAYDTPESDWFTPAGFTFYSLTKIRERIKAKLWNASYLADDILTDWINEWLDEMTNAAIQSNEAYALGTTNIAFGTNGYGTITASDFKQVNRLWVTYDGVNKFRSTKMEDNTFMPDQQFNATHPYHYYLGDSVFGVKPEQSGGTAEIVYYKRNAQMSNDTDELPVPMRGYTKSFVNYGLAQALKKDGKRQEADDELVEALAARAQFLTEIAPRDKTGNTYITLTEAISGEDSFWM